MKSKIVLVLTLSALFMAYKVYKNEDCNIKCFFNIVMSAEDISEELLNEEN